METQGTTAEPMEPTIKKPRNISRVDSPKELNHLSPKQKKQNTRRKSFKCKKCNFVATAKLDLWEHSRIHIPATKLRACPSCSFVTEYQAHLAYHMRNHSDSKPFQCDKCGYSCINKFMLASHLKTHSTVCQFRCADCSYATRWRNSFKSHLRKNGHKSAAALNTSAPSRGSVTLKAKQKRPRKTLPMRQVQFISLSGSDESSELCATLLPAFMSFPFNQLFGGPVSNPFSIDSCEHQERMNSETNSMSPPLSTDEPIVDLGRPRMSGASKRKARGVMAVLPMVKISSDE